MKVDIIILWVGSMCVIVAWLCLLGARISSLERSRKDMLTHTEGIVEILWVHIRLIESIRIMQTGEDIVTHEKPPTK